VGAVSRPESRPADSKNLGQARESASNPATSGIAASVSAAASSAANAVPTSTAELQTQLAAAKAQILELKNQAGSGLRQRMPESTQQVKEKLQTATSTQNAPTGGVSVQITAALCLLSFLLAYFLF
jgi:F0F1-type ATP synthase membrane subunit b/b'